MSDIKKDVAECRRVSIDLLARREHSEFELRRKLEAKGFESEIVDDTIPGLLAKGYLSNTRFIESYIRARRAKGYGPIRIQVELNARGLTTDVIEQHLKMNDNAWLECAQLAWEKKFKALQPRDFTERAKQMRFLQYRGFTQTQIESILQSDNEHA